ncbi:L,D-transpeptidase [Phaeovulum vinaykumarii]|uniref:Lipoprotein-anchoring transpeptidase ErfK/SrfK n=1 Tax=Phaeovulum vinaykumarii TaxID=407234 RepID=A0A1N7LUK7_9RHOB|nr:L,D-transpeptidase [Phaeovulum vinaykumarii]SIS77548.1 Lipoprotein-anchoring transpeptidase ErfK/SrfK [Phaeovulum vinaykumarii]SOC07391.1 lipoprotein-anchoring transpeptidase ErfK/SrfK [Phaeovulum vinaykumarii]
MSASVDRRLLLSAALAAVPLAAPALVPAPAAAEGRRPAAKPAVTPETAPQWPIAPQFYPTKVWVRPEFTPGSIVVLSDQFFLYHIYAPRRAIRYGVAVGRGELKFRGQAEVARKVEWPSWRPTPEMIARSPKYARYADGMPGGPRNPLGARALYLFQNGHDTAIRIHGTTEPASIGHAVSNGCIRMVNDHVIALYDSVELGTPVTVF